MPKDVNDYETLSIANETVLEVVIEKRFRIGLRLCRVLAPTECGGGVGVGGGRGEGE